MHDLKAIGREWLVEQVAELTDHIDRVGPVEYNEANRYIPDSVSPLPGPMSFDVNPFMREIVQNFDVDSSVRETSVMKGVQITYTTALESIFLYFLGHVRTVPCMFMTADKELSAARIENNFLPMIQQSGFSDRVRSSDETSKHKSGATKNHIQWDGGGYLIPYGARNADKMRSFSILLMLMDELDAWPDKVGKDGDPNKLATARTAAYHDRRKIFRGSTPLIKSSSKIYKEYKRGDQRKYYIRCIGCGFAQVLRWSGTNEKTGLVYGFTWDLDDGQLVPDSVRFVCRECGHEHHEHDKERLFSPEHGAEWRPTARAVEPGIRSYHLPALYSPVGMQPWSRSVALYLEAFDPVERKVRDIGALQVFYNNILAEPFEVQGSKIHFTMVSAHRRTCYRLGQIPNGFAVEYAGGSISFLTCVVDVHKAFLAVAVFGWSRDSRCFLVEYMALEDNSAEGCIDPGSPVWGQLREIIEEKEWTSDDDRTYRVVMTFIDAGYENDLVVQFCAEYASGVYPTLGRDRAAKAQRIQEFAEFRTQAGTVGYRILVDHYKDRLASVLRRDWSESSGTQPAYHFNAAVDVSDGALKELTRETRREKTDERGNVSYHWHRPGNARNELWDLLVLGHASVEVMAWGICRQQFELDTINWSDFWDYVEGGLFYT